MFNCCNAFAFNVWTIYFGFWRHRSLIWKLNPNKFTNTIIEKICLSLICFQCLKQLPFHFFLSEFFISFVPLSFGIPETLLERLVTTTFYQLFQVTNLNCQYSSLTLKIFSYWGLQKHFLFKPQVYVLFLYSWKNSL